jgi:large subunit ribosomal protein L23
MKSSEVLIKPIVSEKSNALSEKRRTYAFRVHRKANKLEVKAGRFLWSKRIDVNTLWFL